MEPMLSNEKEKETTTDHVDGNDIEKVNILYSRICLRESYRYYSQILCIADIKVLANNELANLKNALSVALFEKIMHCNWH